VDLHHSDRACLQAQQAAPTWARSVGSLTGLENSRFSMQPVAVATLNLFCKNYSIVFFVHFGRGELYLEMMVQDKLANPCRVISMKCPFASVWRWVSLTSTFHLHYHQARFHSQTEKQQWNSASA
jgi:hypothetical protein